MINGPPIFSEQCLPTPPNLRGFENVGGFGRFNPLRLFSSIPPIEAKVVCSFEINRYS